MNTYQALDQWIADHFDEEVAYLRELVRVPTDTPPGNNAPHAERAAERYNVSQAEILMELGKRQVVGGQEDMIIDVALELARKHAEAEAADV